MQRKSYPKSYIFSLILGAAILLVAGGSVGATELPATWDNGAPTTGWIDAENWNPSTVGGPCNVGILAYLVTVPDGFNLVTFNASTPCEITDFFLGNNARLLLNPDTDLTVLRTAEIAGIIDAQGGNFNANGSSVAFTDCRARAYASSGSQVLIAAPSYCSSSLWRSAPDNFAGTTFTTNLFSAASNAVLNLSSIQSINAGFDNTDRNDWNVQRISAESGGIIDISLALIITGPKKPKDALVISVDGASSDIDVSSLETINSTGIGHVQFATSNGGNISLPSLLTARQTVLQVQSDGAISINGLQAASYFSTSLWYRNPDNFAGTTFHIDIMNANGSSSLMDLTSIDSIDAGFNNTDINDKNVQHIRISS